MGGEVPEAHGAVEGAAHDLGAVGADGHRGHPAAMAGEDSQVELGSGKLADQSSCPTGEITVLRARGEMHHEGGLACPWPAKKPTHLQGPALPLTWDQLYPLPYALLPT